VSSLECSLITSPSTVPCYILEWLIHPIIRLPLLWRTVPDGEGVELLSILVLQELILPTIIAYGFNSLQSLLLRVEGDKDPARDSGVHLVVEDPAPLACHCGLLFLLHLPQCVFALAIVMVVGVLWRFLERKCFEPLARWRDLSCGLGAIPDER